MLLEVVQDLVEHHEVDVNTEGRDKVTALHIAANNGTTELVAYLLEHGADKDLKQLVKAHTPLQVACSAGNHVAYRCLQPKSRFSQTVSNILPKDSHGNSLMHLVCQSGNEGLLEELLSTAPSDALHYKNLCGYTPLHCAAQCGHRPIVNLIWLHDVQIPRLQEAQDNVGKTPLMVACSHGFEHVAQCLIEASDSYLNFNDQGGDTALHLACYGGHLAVARYLTGLERIEFRRNFKGKTPLHCACEFGRLNVVRFLMEECGRGFDDIADLDISAISEKVREYLLTKKADDTEREYQKTNG